MYKERKVLFNCAYCSLFEDGDIGFSDGVGFVGSIEGQEVRDLYEALKEYFGEKNSKNKDSLEPW